MTKQELTRYLETLKRQISLDRYVERRFTAADAGGGLPADFDCRFLGSLREREPRLAELLTHPRVMVLAEPGGGKSVIAQAAVLQILGKAERVPVLVELKGYRTDLPSLIRQSAPPEILDLAASVDGMRIRRTYVLDGADEVPRELIQQFATDFRTLLKADPDAHFFVTARQAFYVAEGSVNRWEGGHSAPTGPTLDLYAAMDAAIRAGNSPEAIRRAAKNERGAFLYLIPNGLCRRERDLPMNVHVRCLGPLRSGGNADLQIGQRSDTGERVVVISEGLRDLPSTDTGGREPCLRSIKCWRPTACRNPLP